ncbi:MAG: hypothetical protein AAGF98_00330 [Cyanobacteria bacterium P01_H01_bin.153]
MSRSTTRNTKGVNLFSSVLGYALVFREVTTSYVYASAETWAKYDYACQELGWQKKTLLTQLLHSYGSAELAYYREAAEMDAVARGFEGHQGEHYQLLRDWSELPKYAAAQPPFNPSPLASIPDVATDAAGRRSFSSIRCSGRNSAILHLATIIERANVPQTLSRIMLWHFDRYWEKGYLYQLEADKQQTLSPKF